MKRSISEEEFKEACQTCNGIGEVIRKLGLNENGVNRNHLRELSKVFGIELPKYVPKTRYTKITKECPVCGEVFETLQGHLREKTVCSHSCSNTHFRSGPNNPNFKNGGDGEKEYRRICFSHHERSCIICGFNYIVEVHHNDCNNQNNDPSNLIPLCPNHHKMFHSRHRGLVSPLIEEYLGKWKGLDKEIP